MENYGDQLQKYIICAGPYKVENHQCGVTRYQKGKEKIYVHITPKCANCTGAHAANSSRCTSRYKAEINPKKEKKTKKIQKENKGTNNIGNEIKEKEKKLSLQLDINMELGKLDSKLYANF